MTGAVTGAGAFLTVFAGEAGLAVACPVYTLSVATTTGASTELTQVACKRGGAVALSFALVGTLASIDARRANPGRVQLAYLTPPAGATQTATFCFQPASTVSAAHGFGTTV